MKVTAQSDIYLQVQLNAGGHHLIADEPPSAGGADTGPNPYGLLLSALAACKIMTAQMYADRKGWAVKRITAELENYKVAGKDCEDCETNSAAKVDIIEVSLKFEGDLTAEQIQRLTQIADRCPIHRTLTSETVIRTTIQE
jgi:putative redox protein